MIHFLKSRIWERSTFVGVAGAVVQAAVAAAALDAPWRTIIFVLSLAQGVAAALTPDGCVRSKDTEHLLASPKNAGRLHASVRKLDRKPPT